MVEETVEENLGESKLAMTEEEMQRIADLVAARLTESAQQKAPPAAADGEIDWRLVKIPKFGSRRIQTAKLDHHSLAWLKVVALLLDKNLATMVQTAILTYLNRNKRSHLDRLHTVATREGVTLEEAVEKILSGEIKPN